jgi:site-specific DNA recombinase
MTKLAIDIAEELARLSTATIFELRAIATSRQPIELTPARLVALSRNLPHDWQEQRRLLGFSPA